MSSKNVEPALRRPVRPNPRSTLSIRRRLTLYFVLSTAALLLVAGGFLYRVLRQSLEERDRALLDGKVEVLRVLLLDRASKPDLLENEVEHEAGGGPLKYYLRVLEPDGRIRAETPGMAGSLPAGLFPPPTSLGLDASPAVRRLGHDGRTFILRSVRLERQTGGVEATVIQASLDVSLDEALLAGYRRQLLGVLVLGGLFAALAGEWAARKGMRPLRAITDQALEVTASQLGERLAPSHWPTELAELAQAFNIMLDRLEVSFTRLSEFSADLAHELRTPISNLRGEAEVALTRSRTVEDYQQVLGSSLEEYDRLARMIDGLLLIARAEDPEAVAGRRRFDARTEVDAVIEFFEAVTLEHGVKLTAQGQGWGLADPDLFRRALINLVSNSLRHTQAGGEVVISLQVSSEGALEVTVGDTGSGIPPQDLPRIFDRFYRADRSRSGSTGGTGLGLAIVNSIMRLHGGSAEAESVPGQGTSIRLRFPG